MKRISERADELQPTVRLAMVEASRKILEEKIGSLTDTQWQEVIKQQDQTLDLSSSVAAFAVATDEWQGSVEKRLAEVRHACGFDRQESASASTTLRPEFRSIKSTLPSEYAPGAATEAVISAPRFDEEKPPTQCTFGYESDPVAPEGRGER